MIKCLDQRLKTRADESVRDSHLTYAQIRVLKVIWEHGGQATQKEIEDALGVTHPTVVGLVKRLEKNDYVSCHTDPVDRRYKIVCGTALAMEHRAWHDARIRQTEELLTRGLSEEEIAQLKRLLRHIYKNVE